MIRHRAGNSIGTGTRLGRPGNRAAAKETEIAPAADNPRRAWRAGRRPDACGIDIGQSRGQAARGRRDGRVDGRVSAGGDGLGRALPFAGQSRAFSASRVAGRVNEADVVQWRLALKRRCPSIIASADEYDEDLVRLCRTSVGL